MFIKQYASEHTEAALRGKDEGTGKLQTDASMEWIQRRNDLCIRVAEVIHAELIFI